MSVPLSPLHSQPPQAQDCAQERMSAPDGTSLRYGPTSYSADALAEIARRDEEDMRGEDTDDPPTPPASARLHPSAPSR